MKSRLARAFPLWYGNTVERLKELRQWPGLGHALDSKVLRKCFPLDKEGLFWGELEPESYFVEKLFYCSEGEEWGRKVLAAGLCLLLQGTDYTRWGRLEGREFENFLRTENHRSAFEEHPWLEAVAEELLESVKKNLLLAFFKFNGERLGDFPIVWPHSPLKRMRAALHIQRALFHPFCKNFALDWELFALEGQTFIFKGGALKAWELSALEEFLCYIFQKEGLNIVAEI